MTYSQSNTTTTTELWSQERTCSDCGQGVFVLRGRIALCTNCDHEHGLDPVNLDAGERFVWRDERSTTTGPTLHVVCEVTR